VGFKKNPLGRFFPTTLSLSVCHFELPSLFSLGVGNLFTITGRYELWNVACGPKRINFRVFKGVLETRLVSLELKIGSLESEKIIKENIYEISSEIFRVPTGPYRVPIIFLKKTLINFILKFYLYLPE